MKRNPPVARWKKRFLAGALLLLLVTTNTSMAAAEIPQTSPEELLEAGADSKPETEISDETEADPETEISDETGADPETEISDKTEADPENEIIGETEADPENEIIDETVEENISDEDILMTSTTEGTCGKHAVWTYASGVLTISGTGSIDNYEEYGEKAPWIKKKAKSVVIEEGITGIGRYAFFNMATIKSISLPETLTIIKEGAFCGCSALTSVTIPASVEKVSTYAFAWCTSLTQINGGEGLHGFGYYAFGGCRKLTKYTFTAVNFDTYFAFEDCPKLTITGTMGDGFTFTYKNGVMKVYGSGKMPDYTYHKLTKVTVDADTGETRYHGSDAFSWEGLSVTELRLSATIKNVGAYAFAWCEQINSVRAMGALQIRKGAFRHTYRIEELSLGRDLSAIGKNAFKRNKCKHPTVYFNNTREAFGKIKFSDGNTTIQNAYVQYQCLEIDFTSVSRGDGVIRLSWEADAAVEGYEIYTAASANGSFRLLDSVENTEQPYYDHKDCTFAKPYYYKVIGYRTINGQKKYRRWSQVIMGRALPRQAKSVKAKKDVLAIRLTWKAVKGADGYLVIRTDNENQKTTYTAIKNTSFKDTDLTDGQTYTYKVKAYVKYKKDLYYGSGSTAVSVTW